MPYTKSLSQWLHLILLISFLLVLKFLQFLFNNSLSNICAIEFEIEIGLMLFRSSFKLLKFFKIGRNFQKYPFHKYYLLILPNNVSLTSLTIMDKFHQLLQVFNFYFLYTRNPFLYHKI
jgi:hypothetical protein